MTELQTLDGIALWDGREDRGRSRLSWRGDELLAVEPSEVRIDETLSVIPGLVDTHVHLDTAAAGVHDRAWSLITSEADKALHVLGHALRFAAYGVTTLRDLAAAPAQLAVARALDDGTVHGPRLLAYGPVGMTGGHLDMFTPAGAKERAPLADGVDECRRLVRRWAREGAHGIKIYTSGGIMSHGSRLASRGHTPAEIEAIVDEAHALGLPVAAHAHSVEGTDLALAVGVDTLEHGTGIGRAHHETLLTKNIAVVPTLTVHDVILAGTDPARADARRKARETLARRDPAFREAAAAGVRFVLGTDANGHLVPHGGQHAELHRIQELLGWDARRTLIAATSDAAAAVGLGERVGTLAPGYGADFVVVRGRPWERVEDLTPDAIVAVVARGRVLAGRLPG